MLERLPRQRCHMGPIQKQKPLRKSNPRDADVDAASLEHKALTPVVT